MTEHDENLNAILQEVKEDVIIIKTVLLGTDGNPGQGGLVEKVDKIEHKQSKLSRNFYILIGVLIGSGIVTADQLLGLF